MGGTATIALPRTIALMCPPEIRTAGMRLQAGVRRAVVLHIHGAVAQENDADRHITRGILCFKM